MRLKPHAIDIRVSVDPVHYFLNDKDDTRSSYYLEDAATEFQVQGLELDWVCVSGDGDFRFNGSGLELPRFPRQSVVQHRKPRQSELSAQRVSRSAHAREARHGRVRSAGRQADPTRSPAFYNSTFKYLKELGISEIA